MEENNDEKDDDTGDSKTRKRKRDIALTLEDSNKNGNDDGDGGNVNCINDDDDDIRVENINPNALTFSRILANCTAFICIIFITIGELMNEQNLIAVIVLGGTLSIINVVSTSINLDKLNATKGDDRNVGFEKTDDDVDNNKTAGTKATMVRFSETSPKEEESKERGKEGNLTGTKKKMDDNKRNKLSKRHNNSSKRMGMKEIDGMKRSNSCKTHGLPPGAIAIDIDRHGEHNHQDEKTIQRHGHNDDLKIGSRSRPRRPRIVHDDSKHDNNNDDSDDDDDKKKKQGMTTRSSGHVSRTRRKESYMGWKSRKGGSSVRERGISKGTHAGERERGRERDRERERRRLERRVERRESERDKDRDRDKHPSTRRRKQSRGGVDDSHHQ